MREELTLTINDQIIGGWTDVRVTRGIERCPSDFHISLTELHPDELAAVAIYPGVPATVSLGGDVVITGFIDRFVPSISPRGHDIVVSGRSKCADLVDCAARWDTGQINNATAADIAKKMAAFYNVEVRCDVSDLKTVDQFNLMLTETCFEVIERVARFSALLAYDEPDGALRLGRVGTTSAGSGFAQGDNVQEATIVYSADQTYQTYMAFRQSVDLFADVGDTGNIVEIHDDVNVKRPRLMVLIAESGDADNKILKDRVLWEAQRRRGHSRVVKVVCDSWRDAGGTLWTPNTLASVDLPALKLQADAFLISEVTYIRDGERGTVAEVTLMAPEAFNPEPILWMPDFGDVPYVAPQTS